MAVSVDSLGYCCSPPGRLQGHSQEGTIRIPTNEFAFRYERYVPRFVFVSRREFGPGKSPYHLEMRSFFAVIARASCKAIICRRL